MQLSPAAGGSDTDPSLSVAARRAGLLPAYTAVTIAAGIAALVATTVSVPLASGIAVPGLAPAIGLPAGVVLWTVFGLAGAARTVRGPNGHGALTFHLPFIVAAMTLGGPVAGGWVAMIASIEAREVREVPWYGILANHASLSLSAIAGGFVVLAVEALGAGGQLPGSAPPDIGLTLVAAVAGSLVTVTLSTALALGVIVLRDGLTARETLFLFDRAFRGTTVAEALLGWVFLVVYLAAGWWAPAVCTAVVLAVWRVGDEGRGNERDELTGLLSRSAFSIRATEATDRARRGTEASAYLFIDLDGFKAMNDGPRDHEIGDQVLAEVGARLRRLVRVSDAAGRRGGDEFMVLYRGLRDPAAALALASRVHATITEPYATDAGEKRIGASIGVALAMPGDLETEQELRQRADAALHDAKRAGGGVSLWRSGPTA